MCNKNFFIFLLSSKFRIVVNVELSASEDEFFPIIRYSFRSERDKLRDEMETLRQLKKEEDERRAAEAALEAERLAEEKRQAELDKEEREKVIQEATERLRKETEEAEEKRKKEAEEAEEKRKKEAEERKEEEDDNGNGGDNGNGAHDDGNGADGDGGDNGNGTHDYRGGNDGDGDDSGNGDDDGDGDDDNSDSDGGDGGAAGVGAAVGTDEEEMCAGLMAFHCDRAERRAERRLQKIKSLDEEISRIREKKHFPKQICLQSPYHSILSTQSFLLKQKLSTVNLYAGLLSRSL